MLWVKALHIIFVVCWFAGLFYLPRLYVYHAQNPDQAVREQFKVMERKLFRFTSIFAVLTLVFGGWLISFNAAYYMQAGWFHAKLALVLALYAYHGLCGRERKRLYNDQLRSHVFYRWFNEAPVLILFAVVILVVVKPF